MRPYHADPEYYAGRAFGLLASAEDGTEDAVAAFARHDAPLTLEGARVVIAREHDFAGWQELNDGLADLDGDPFVRAYGAIEAHDAAAQVDVPACTRATCGRLRAWAGST